MSGRFKDKKVAVLLGGRSSEREVSQRTGGAVLKALEELGYAAVPVDPAENFAARLAEIGAEVVFNALHGTWGEDGCVQGFLEILGLPYTGAGVLASAAAMNKVVSKRLFESAWIRVPPWRSFRDRKRAIDSAIDWVAEIGYPAVVKPSSEGSSVGVVLAHDEGELRTGIYKGFEMDDEVIVEGYIWGREVNVALLGDDVLGTVEIRPKREFYDYTAKYDKSAGTEYLVPAPVDRRTKERLGELAQRANRLIGGEGVVRVDFILDETLAPYVLEVNTLPGLTETSLIPKIAAQKGIEFPQLVERILDTARIKTGGG